MHNRLEIRHFDLAPQHIDAGAGGVHGDPELGAFDDGGQIGRLDFEVFDVANIDQKGFSERMVSAPVSPLGQRTRVQTKYATAVALPSTLALDPARTRLPENEEQPIDLFYAFVYVSDREEGIVGSNVATLVDGNPDNNFLHRDVTFNPDGMLTGASYIVAAGHRLYVTTPRGLFVVDCTDPMHPHLAGQYSGAFLRENLDEWRWVCIQGGFYRS